MKESMVAQQHWAWTIRARYKVFLWGQTKISFMWQWRTDMHTLLPREKWLTLFFHPVLPLSTSFPSRMFWTATFTYFSPRWLVLLSAPQPSTAAQDTAFQVPTGQLSSLSIAGGTGEASTCRLFLHKNGCILQLARGKTRCSSAVTTLHISAVNQSPQLQSHSSQGLWLPNKQPCCCSAHSSNSPKHTPNRLPSRENLGRLARLCEIQRAIKKQLLIPTTKEENATLDGDLCFSIMFHQERAALTQQMAQTSQSSEGSTLLLTDCCSTSSGMNFVQMRWSRSPRDESLNQPHFPLCCGSWDWAVPGTWKAAAREHISVPSPAFWFLQQAHWCQDHNASAQRQLSILNPASHRGTACSTTVQQQGGPWILHFLRSLMEEPAYPPCVGKNGINCFSLGPLL